MKVKEIIKILEAAGWKYSHTAASHHVFKKEGVPVNISVPGHLSDDLKKGTEYAIRKKAGLT